VSERSLRNEIENMRTKFITNTTTFETEITETKTKVSTQFSSLNDEVCICVYAYS
jgi:hypothetical protein